MTCYAITFVIIGDREGLAVRVFVTFFATLLFAFAVILMPRQPALAQAAGEVWITTKDTGSIAILEAFIEAFPDSVYAKFAKARVKELRAQSGLSGSADRQLSTQPAPRESTGQIERVKKSEQPELHFASKRELVRAVQRELKKQRCYSAKVDGIWGNGSHRAVATFIKYASVAVSNEPSKELFNTLRTTSGPVCPLNCGVRYTANNGKCVLKTCKKGQRLSRGGKCVKPVAKRPCREWRWRHDDCGAYLKNSICYIPKSQATNFYCNCPAKPRQFRHCEYDIVEGAG